MREKQKPRNLFPTQIFFKLKPNKFNPLKMNMKKHLNTGYYPTTPNSHISVLNINPNEINKRKIK